MRRVSYDPNADHYVLLGVPDAASHDEIKAAFRKLIKRVHPDKPTGDGAKAAALNVAWDVLGDAQKRAAYDDARHRHLRAVAARAAKVAAATRAKNGRASAPAVVAPKAAALVRVRSATSAAQNAVGVAVDNLVRSLRNKQYGRAFGWFLLGMAVSEPRRSRRRPSRRPPSRPRRRR